MSQLRATSRRVLAVLLLAVGLANSASAQVCTAAVAAPVFSGYAMASVLGTGKVTVTCVVVGLVPAPVAYTIHIGWGVQAEGTQRRMLLGPRALAYNLYCSGALTQVWGDGSAGTCTISGGHPGLIGTTITDHTIYGRIPANQAVPAGVYVDVLPVTVLY